MAALLGFIDSSNYVSSGSAGANSVGGGVGTGVDSVAGTGGAGGCGFG